MRSLITQQGVIIVNHTRNKELRTACSTSVSRDANNGEKCKLMQLCADVETGERGRETGGREGGGGEWRAQICTYCLDTMREARTGGG